MRVYTDQILKRPAYDELPDLDFAFENKEVAEEIAKGLGERYQRVSN